MRGRSEYVALRFVSKSVAAWKELSTIVGDWNRRR